MICSMTLCVSLSPAAASNKCLDFYRQVESRVQRTSQYEKDFGAGVYVRKVSNEEFRIEPPLEVATSIRQAHQAVSKRSGGDGKRMTILFGGFSEGEVIGFRAMLLRDVKIKDNATLTSILLSGEAASGRSYDGVRELALAARDKMNRRYRWADATIENKTLEAGDREERYLLTARLDDKPEEFLLRVRLRTARALKNRVGRIGALLSRPVLVNATSEQVAHEMISSLKMDDPEITSVTLKVIAGDFVIADRR